MSDRTTFSQWHERQPRSYRSPLWSCWVVPLSSRANFTWPGDTTPRLASGSCGSSRALLQRQMVGQFLGCWRKGTYTLVGDAHVPIDPFVSVNDKVIQLQIYHSCVLKLHQDRTRMVHRRCCFHKFHWRWVELEWWPLFCRACWQN